MLSLRRVTFNKRHLKYDFRSLLILALFFVYFILIKGTCATVASYIWPLSYIYNNTIPVTPPMIAHGGVKQVNDSGLGFDGIDDWIDAGDFSDECISTPSVCENGLSVGMRIHLDQYQFTEFQRKYIFDSGGHDGNGVSIFTENNQIVGEVASNGNVWKVSSFVDPKKWHFILITWSPISGILLFVDGPLFSKSYTKSVMARNTMSNNRINIGRTNSPPYEETYGNFTIEMISIFNDFVENGKIFLSYSFSPPGQKRGNIRYVNARFINKAGFDVRIFPDRGLKKTIGYVVAKQSSTLLEFVLKEGPLPYGMDFNVRRNDTHEVLLFHNKEWVHVAASDDSQVIAELTINEGAVSTMIFSSKGLISHFNPKKIKPVTDQNQASLISNNAASAINNDSNKTFSTPTNLPFTTPTTATTTTNSQTLSSSPVTMATTTYSTSASTTTSTDANESTFSSSSTSLPNITPTTTTVSMTTTSSTLAVASATTTTTKSEINSTSTVTPLSSTFNTSDLNISTTSIPVRDNVLTFSNNISTTPSYPNETTNEPVVIDKEEKSHYDIAIQNVFDKLKADSNHTENNDTSKFLTINIDTKDSNPPNTSVSRTDLSGPSSNETAVKYIAGLTNETCLYCGKDQIVISTEKNKNQSFVENLNVLSAIKGDINTTRDDLNKTLNNETNDIEGTWSAAEPEISTTESTTKVLTTSVTTSNLSETTSTFSTATTTLSTSPTPVKSTTSTTTKFSLKKIMSTTPFPNLNNIPVKPDSALDTTQKPTITLSKIPIIDLPPPFPSLSPFKTTKMVDIGEQGSMGAEKPFEIGKPLGEHGQMGSENKQPPPQHQSTTERPILGPEIIKFQTPSSTPSTLTAKQPILPKIPVELSSSKVNNGGIDANSKTQYQIDNDCGQIACPDFSFSNQQVVMSPAISTSTKAPTITESVKQTTRKAHRSTKPLFDVALHTVAMSTKYLTHPSPTGKTKRSTTTTTIKTPTKSKVHIQYPTPRFQYCCNTSTGVVKPIQPSKSPGYQVDIHDWTQLPADGTRIDQGFMLSTGDCFGKPNCQPTLPQCHKLPKCNATIVGMEFKGKLLGKLGLSMLLPNGDNNMKLHKQELDLNQFDANFKINNPYAMNNLKNYNNALKENNLYGTYQSNSPYQNYYGYYQGFNSHNNPAYFNYLNQNNYGTLGSPQVFNWKDAWLRTRSASKNLNKETTMKDEMLDDEVLNSIKDVSATNNGNIIYMSDNPKLDNLSPTKLWKNSMVITINKGLPVMTSAHLLPTNKDEEKEKNLPLAGTTETLSGHPGLTLMLTDISNNTIHSSQFLTPHGPIHRWQGGLKFDGKTSWVELNTINTTFLTDPSLATDGFGLGFKLMMDKSIEKIETPGYVLDGGGGLGHGVSVFIVKGNLFCIVSINRKMWQVNATVIADEWMYAIFSFHPEQGLSVYINGIQQHHVNKYIQSGSSIQKSNEVTIGTNQKKDENAFLLMYLVSIDLIFKSVNEKDAVEFAPPLTNNHYILTFSSLENNHLRGHDNMKMHGNVKENRGTLVFDGVHSYLHDTGEFSDTYIMMPSLNPAGLSVSIKFKFDRTLLSSTNEKFIIDTGGWLGHGVSLFVHEGQLTAVVGSKGYVWVVQTVETSYTSWAFVLITWREDMGIYLYMNGALVGKDKAYKYLIDEYAAFDGMTIASSVLKNSQSFGRFHLAMISFFPSYTSIDELMKFSPPLVLRPTFDWFFMLIQHNATLTSPQLKVVGDLKATDEGLSFDGKSGYLNAGSLDEASEENGDIICEHYEREISCPDNQVLKITYANYGRLSEIPCQGKRKYISTNCRSKKSFFLARQLCDNKRTCLIKALNSVWGNTCPGVLKYMDIRYQCTRKSNNSHTNTVNFITNPSLTHNGVTIATKIRIDNEAAFYQQPKYIFDSGGSTYGSGISLYIADQMLICEISNNGKLWKLNTTLETNDWLYLVITWSSHQGLVLYVNGKLTNVVSQPYEINNVQNSDAGSLYIGRSLSNGNDSFAKFQMTVFTVLKTYVSKSESYRLFAYYVGRAITNAFEVASISKDTVLICEYEMRTISCPLDQVIEMVYANYGRTSTRPCAWGTHHDTNCTLASAINVARDHCNGKNSCDLVAKNSMWKTNPCPGIIKYVEVKYICNKVPPSQMTNAKYVGNEDPNSLVIP